MIWDISIQLPREIQSIDEIPADFQPPLGALQRRLKEHAHSGRSLPDFFGRGFNSHPVRGGEGAVATIARLLEHLELRAIDCQTGDFFSASTAEDSFTQWQSFRDRAISSGESSEP